ncbi:threonine/homoserine/homoserine lactone efflux protein [Bacillus sp. V2I10]|nr:threonine/homoserine/homoserine lactone efflux protein [Bacillus sp. V2I10]
MAIQPTNSIMQIFINGLILKLLNPFSSWEWVYIGHLFVHLI